MATDISTSKTFRQAATPRKSGMAAASAASSRSRFRPHPRRAWIWAPSSVTRATNGATTHSGGCTRRYRRNHHEPPPGDVGDRLGTAVAGLGLFDLARPNARVWRVRRLQVITHGHDGPAATGLRCEQHCPAAHLAGELWHVQPTTDAIGREPTAVQRLYRCGANADLG